MKTVKTTHHFIFTNTAKVKTLIRTEPFLSADPKRALVFCRKKGQPEVIIKSIATQRCRLLWFNKKWCFESKAIKIERITNHDNYINVSKSVASSHTLVLLPTLPPPLLLLQGSVKGDSVFHSWNAIRPSQWLYWRRVLETEWRRSANQWKQPDNCNSSTTRMHSARLLTRIFATQAK